MVRFTLNRWSGFVLTLCLLTASFLLLNASAPSTARAETGGSLLLPTDPTSPGGSAQGDPDVPMGPGDGKSGLTWKRVGRVDVNRTVVVQEARRAGDVTVTGSVVMDHVRLLLSSLRSLYLGF